MLRPPIIIQPHFPGSFFDSLYLIFVHGASRMDRVPIRLKISDIRMNPYSPELPMSCAAKV